MFWFGLLIGLGIGAAVTYIVMAAGDPDDTARRMH